MTPEDERALKAIKLSRQLFVVTLSDDEFEKLSDRRRHLTETLVTSGGLVEVIIQRTGE